jgi:hypothetical protein
MRCVSLRIKNGIKRDVWSVDRESTYLMNVRHQKVVIAINVDHSSILILNVKRYSMLLLIAFIVGREDILRESARRMRRDFIRKEDHALVVGRWGIYWKIVLKEMRIIKLGQEHLRIPNNFDHYYLYSKIVI